MTENKQRKLRKKEENIGAERIAGHEKNAIAKCQAMQQGWTCVSLPIAPSKRAGWRDPCIDARFSSFSALRIWRAVGTFAWLEDAIMIVKGGELRMRLQIRWE